MRKFLALLVVLSIITLSGTAFAASSDVPASSEYYSAVGRVTSLGLMDNAANNAFKPNDATTREQFAKLIVIAAGLSDTADSMKGPTIFSDVPANGENNGYINLSISKGFMAGLADGRFHPSEAVTYAQAVTAMIRVLGYTDADIPGTWPKNYMEKAKSLGLAVNASLSATSKVPRGVMAQMLDVLLDTKIKSANSQEASKTLAETAGLTTAGMYTVYSKPLIYYKADVANFGIGGLDLSGRLNIVRNSVDNSTSPATVTNGEAIKPSDIQDFNVLYQVSDKSGKNKYILVIDNKVTGTLTGILPDKNAPQKIEVDGRAYELDKSFDTSKLSGTNSFSLDDGITLLLGYDGKVVDMQEALYSDNSSFAFVMNYNSYKASVSGLTKYTVKLLMPNGSVSTFDAASNPSTLKGKLVIYTKNSDNSVNLTDINYSTTGELYIDKENRRIFSNYNNYCNEIAGNVKIFNYISNNAEVDAQAQVLSWSDLPSGTLRSGKVLFLNKTGDFEDVNLLLLNNVDSKSYVNGIVKSAKSQILNGRTAYTYTISVAGKDFTYAAESNAYDIGPGSVVRLSMSGNAIGNILEVRYPDSQAYMLEAVDKDRIRLNSRTYTFTDDKLIYLLDSAGSVKTIETSQLRTDAAYDLVSVYTDVSYTSGGKAEIVIIKSY
ncbi:MAG TPA: S-layer homology domain-containing protein [Clostridia bacterium]|nr:S-layer homology domain-containing protein [Clostridia bacterium]